MNETARKVATTTYAEKLMAGDYIVSKGRTIVSVEVGQRWVWCRTDISGEVLSFSKYEVLQVRR